MVHLHCQSLESRFHHAVDLPRQPGRRIATMCRAERTSQAGWMEATRTFSARSATASRIKPEPLSRSFHKMKNRYARASVFTRKEQWISAHGTKAVCAD